MTIKDEKQNKKICEDENIQFNFLGTKIKIRYIYKDKNLFNPSIFVIYFILQHKDCFY